jgi:hypothetical protein
VCRFTDDPGWKTLEPNSLLLIDAGRRVRTVPWSA